MIEKAGRFKFRLWHVVAVLNDVAARKGCSGHWDVTVEMDRVNLCKRLLGNAVFRFVKKNWPGCRDDCSLHTSQSLCIGPEKCKKAILQQRLMLQYSATSYSDMSWTSGVSGHGPTLQNQTNPTHHFCNQPKATQMSLWTHPNPAQRRKHNSAVERVSHFDVTAPNITQEHIDIRRCDDE